MKGANRKKINLWGHIVEYEEPAPGSKIAAIKARIDARLAAFDDHKEELLTLLYDVYKRGPQSKGFDRDKAWGDVRFCAGQLFLQESAKREQLTMSPANRVKRLRKLADALGRARCAADQAIRDDLGDELCRVWRKRRGKRPEAQQPQQDPLHTEQEFRKAVENLAALEIAALCAIREIPKRNGRLGGNGILPYGVIIILGRLYLGNTEVSPGAGPGPFARFVLEFLSALGHRNVVYHSVTEAIKNARKADQMLPVVSDMRPSPFNLGGKTPRISGK